MAEESEKFDLQFKKMIKDVIAEEGYFKEENIKNLITSILSEIDPLISDHVKKHFYEIGSLLMDKWGDYRSSIIKNPLDITGEEKDA